MCAVALINTLLASLKSSDPYSLVLAVITSLQPLFLAKSSPIPPAPADLSLQSSIQAYLSSLCRLWNGTHSHMLFFLIGRGIPHRLTLAKTWHQYPFIVRYLSMKVGFQKNQNRLPLGPDTTDHPEIPHPVRLSKPKVQASCGIWSQAVTKLLRKWA